MTGALLGFGVSGPHGAPWFSERDLARLVAQAIDGGIRHFDTAPFYGEAEARLGRALSALKVRDAIVSTKTGTRREARRVIKDFSAAAIRANAEASLRRLNTDCLAALYLHGPSALEVDAAQAALDALKRDGKIAAYGVCGSGASLERAVAQGYDAIMGAYNIIDRRHAPVFASARAGGLATVSIAPLAEGAVARPLFLPRRPADLWRIARAVARGPRGVADARRLREALARDPQLSPAGAALAFVLQSGVAGLTLTTTANPAHLAESLEAARLGLHPDTAAALSPQSWTLSGKQPLDPAGGRS